LFIVTGGASGLGAATAAHLCRSGACVAIVDRELDAGQALAATLGENAAAFVSDVTDEAGVKACVDAVVDHFGDRAALHGVVNCAGVGAAMTTVNRGGAHDGGVFDFVIQVNLTGTFNFSKFVAAKMVALRGKDARGVIVNTASAAARDGQKGQVAYAASKGAVVAMALPMARDLARWGIRVCTVAPGTIETPMMAAASDNVKAKLLADTIWPKRMGKPQEFAALVAHIIGNDYLNAEVIRLDGGVRMSNL
jgi:NAD(P)-dependent dehydrogenase (short-subunit alcohol dehydrogenase family)